jgi:acyl carrier protein
LQTGTDQLDHKLRDILVDILGLNRAIADNLTHESGLFGTLPELDSMAVTNLLGEIEDRFDIIVDDDEVDGDLLATFGNLVIFVRTKGAC